jgi:hypothetical protein
VKSCSQCVRIRVAVPEAVNQLRNLPGLQVLGAEGTLVEGMADRAALEQLRGHRLVKGVEVTAGGVQVAREQLEPLMASLVNGLVELLHEPGIQLVLLAAALRLALGGRRGG